MLIKRYFVQNKEASTNYSDRRMRDVPFRARSYFLRLSTAFARHSPVGKSKN